MNLNKLTYKQIQEIMDKICNRMQSNEGEDWNDKVWLKWSNDNKKYIKLFSILNCIDEGSSYTYKELLNSKISSK